MPEFGEFQDWSCSEAVVSEFPIRKDVECGSVHIHVFPCIPFKIVHGTRVGSLLAFATLSICC